MSPEETRLRLLAAGYCPLPLAGKRPVIKAWQALVAPTADEVHFWSRTSPAATNTGILTRLTPALDIDILNPDAATAIENLARERFDERGYILVRFGRPPKRCVLFRGGPFPKIVANFSALNGAPAEKLEMLGDGQQVVVNGTHPDTHRCYSWFGGEPGEIKHADLPGISAHEAQALVDDAAQLLVERFGYRLMSTSRPKKTGTVAGGEEHQAGADWQLLFDNVREGRALHDSLRDLAAKMVTAGTNPGAAVNQLRALMEASAAQRDERWKARFAEIPRLVESAEEKLRKPGMPKGHTRAELEARITAAPDYDDDTDPRPNGSESPAADDDAELTRLAKLPLVEYERVRTTAAEALGFRTSILDRLIATERAKLGLDRDDGKQGRPIEFLTPEPWPAPVDGPALLDDVAAVLGCHVVMGEHERVAAAVWSVHTYLLDRLMISPRLAIRSAVKGSGKTTLLDVLARLVPRPLLAASVTASAIFRVIAAHTPTLLVDEADTLFRDGDEALRGVLNAGHRKGGVVLARSATTSSRAPSPVTLPPPLR